MKYLWIVAGVMVFIGLWKFYINKRTSQKLIEWPARKCVGGHAIMAVSLYFSTYTYGVMIFSLIRLDAFMEEYYKIKAGEKCFEYKEQKWQLNYFSRRHFIKRFEDNIKRYEEFGYKRTSALNDDDKKIMDDLYNKNIQSLASMSLN